MGFLKSLMIRVGADTSQVDKELKKASKQVISFGKDMEKAGMAMTKAVTLPILAVGGAAIKMGLDAKETEEKFTYAFGSMADSVRAWSNELSKARGLDAFDFRNTTADMQVLAKGFGFTNEAAADMAKGLSEAAYALAEIYETDAKTMADNFASAFKGRANALKDYGIVIDDTSAKAYAYTHNIAKMGAELTTAQKAQAMYGIIMEASADEMKEFARTGSDLATTMKNKVNTALKEFGVALVESGAFDKFVDLMNRLLDKALELAVAFSNLPAGMQDFIIYTGLAVAALGPLLVGVGNLIQLFGNLGLAAAGAGGSMAGAFAIGAGVAGAGGWVAGQNTAKAGLGFSTGVVGGLPTGGGLTFQERLDMEMAIKNGTYVAGGKVPGFGKAKRYNRFAEEAGAYGAMTGTNAGGSTKDPTLDWMAEYNKMLAEQEKLLKKQEAAAKAAAALNAFRDSVKSLAQAMLDAGRQFANFTGMFDKVDRENVSGNRLARRMEGQLRAMQDWVGAMGSLKGKVSDSLYRELLNMGPGAVDQIKALVNDSGALARYEAAYNERNRLAGGMGEQAAGLNYKADQVIETQINNITVTGSDPEKVADLVVKKLRLAGVY